MSRIAIIPARGGSKRLPKKNILPVLGRAMLHYPVQAALNSGLFDRVIVSTGDDDIRGAALAAGAEVMDRSDHLSGDRATVVQVCLDLLDRLGMSNKLPEWFCCIYATALFITPEDLQAGLRLRDDTPGTNSVMGVSEFNLQPMQALVGGEDGFLIPKWQEYHLQSQCHPDFVASNGTFYWAHSRTFIEQKTFYTDRLKGVKIPWIRAIDVDTPEDYQIALKLAPLFFS